MLVTRSESRVKDSIVRSLVLSSLLTLFAIPANADETVVQKKILMTNDGITETTTTTTTTAPAVEQIVVPAVPATPVIIGEDVVVPAPTAVETTKTVVTSVNGTPVEKVVIDADVYKNSLKVREASLRAAIATGLANGTLSSADAARFRAELDRLAALELSLESSKQFTYERIVPLAYEYDLLGTNLKVVNWQPLVQGTKFVLADTHIYAIDDLMRRRAGLEAKISYELASGKLTVAQADRLRDMLNHVAVIENSYRADGEISDKEAKQLYTEFDRVGSAIDRAI